MINNLLQLLLLNLQSILANQLVGLCVGGSVATNYFNEKTSDIDCYVITENALPKNIIQQLKNMHKQLYLSQIPYAQKIEASYIPKPLLMNFNPKETRPYFNEGKLYIAAYNNNFIIELYILREQGITIFGPKIKQLIKEITSNDLQFAIKHNLIEYWQPMLADVEKLNRHDYQVFAILTMCRTLYTLEVNKISSKPDSANWAIKNTSGPWQELIKKALSWQPEHSFNYLEETKHFINYVLNKSKNKFN
ncbi:aminoglycoside adenylyltransferase domain-containing protein (plasmid) [Legionella sp. D16C41]|uniref:aminoglycoside adenylyltransferase domain-containing protein n=1 Tax=Legionella sp. D16C41 TaxID=3402688 RepID=UPI003AF969C0